MVVILGGLPKEGILLDLPHPGSKPDIGTGLIPSAKFLLAKVPTKAVKSGEGDTSGDKDTNFKWELFELIVFGEDDMTCTLLQDRISTDGKVYTLAKFDMTVMLYFLLAESPTTFAMLDTMISSLAGKYEDFQRLSQVPDLIERLECISESKDIGMEQQVLRLDEEKYKAWIEAKHKKVCDYITEKKLRLPEC